MKRIKIKIKRNEMKWTEQSAWPNGNYQAFVCVHLVIALRWRVIHWYRAIDACTQERRRQCWWWTMMIPQHFSFFLCFRENSFFSLSLSLVCVSMCENNRKMKMHSTTHAHRMIFIMCHGHRQFVLLKIYYSKCAMKGTKCDILCDE